MQSRAWLRVELEEVQVGPTYFQKGVEYCAFTVLRTSGPSSIDVPKLFPGEKVGERYVFLRMVDISNIMKINRYVGVCV